MNRFCRKVVQQQCFSIGEDAKVMSDGKAASMADLRAGSSVKVRYRAKDGALEAHEIHVSMH